MDRMFKNCSSLKELNISNFNINNVADMSYMFLGCSNELMEKIKRQNESFRNIDNKFTESNKKNCIIF